jgi:diguanylate cyclase (GGDEF)-like protein
VGIQRYAAALWLALGCVLVAAVALALSPGVPRATGVPVAEAVQAGTATFAGACLLWRAGRGCPGLRRARVLLGLVALGAGVVIAAGSQAWGPAGAGTSRTGVLLLQAALLPVAAIGLLSYPTNRPRSGSAARILLDSVVAGTACWFVAHALVVAPTGPLSGWELLVPAVDVAAMGLLVGVLPLTDLPYRWEMCAVAAGLGLVLVADVGTAVVVAPQHGSALGATAQAGFVLLALAALLPVTSAPASKERDLTGQLLGVLPHVCVSTAAVVAVELALSGGVLRGGQVLTATACVVALMLRHTVGARDRRELEGRLRSREVLFRTLVTGSSDMISLLGPAGEVLYASPAVERLLANVAPNTEALLAVVHPDDLLVFADGWQRALEQPGLTIECHTRTKWPHEPGYRWTQTLLCNRLGQPGVDGVVVNSRDVHEGHELERRLSHAALHDALTGLGNLNRARAALAECYDSSPPIAATVVLVDLDGFKAVNDAFGHAQGDTLLVAVADRLRMCVRGDDEVTRIGGDEFVLVLRGASADVADRVLEALRTPMVVAGTPLPVGASLGIATTADAASPDELLRNADLAMYASKAAGRNQITPYHPQMHEAAAYRMRVHRGLRRALDTGALALHYQPIVSLPDGRITGAEALLRWDDPEMGPMSPADFIPVAEESGIIVEIDRWVLDRACSDIRAWRHTGQVVPRVSVNVSRRHMTSELPRLVVDTLARHGLSGDSLCLEVTETAVVHDAEVAGTVLRQVRELGVTVALDDFGSGQSSLSQLARLPVDTVKIDMSFTRAAVEDPAARRLLLSVVRVCQSLALPLVAEGIETAELVQLLAGMGCRQGQGWYFGRAEPAARFAELLVAGRLPVTRALDRVAVGSGGHA